MVGTDRRAVHSPRRARRSRPTKFPGSRPALSDLLSKPQSAKYEKQDRHQDKDGKVRPVFEKMCATQNDRAHQRDEISGREERAQRVKNPGHGFPRKNEAGEKDA